MFQPCLGDIVVIKKRKTGRSRRRRPAALPQPVLKPLAAPSAPAASKGGKLHYRFEIHWTKDVPKNGQKIWGIDATSPTQAQTALQKVLKRALGRQLWTKNIELKPLRPEPPKNNG